MAQLIKLKDFISRYEWDAYRYPSQYIRYKQENWTKLYRLWSDGPDEFLQEESEPIIEETKISKLKSFIRLKNEPVKKLIMEEDILPETEQGLKQYFLDQLYPIQLKWATSTVTDVSFKGNMYDHDAILKYFLQRFPDIYMLMYYPVFNIRNTPIDAEIILISPVGIDIIYLLEGDPLTTFMAGDERTWTVEREHENTKRISPLIALRRTEQIVKSILKVEELDFDVKKIVLSRSNNIVFSSEPYNTTIIGRHQYDKWFKEKRKLSSPLKSQQLKVVEALLKNCLTTSVKRSEWEEKGPNLFTMDSEK